MKKISPSLMAVAIWCTLYSSQGHTSSTINDPLYGINNKQCLIGIPTFDRPLVEGDINSLPINIQSDLFSANFPNNAVYQGNVEIRQGNRDLSANRVNLETNANRERVVTLQDNIRYQDNLIQMQGDNAAVNLDTNDVQISNSNYHLVGRLGRGSAEDLQLQENRFIVLQDGSFTTCPIDDSSWNIEGAKIIHDNDEQLLEVWHAIFRVGNVPVLYTPYLQLPTGNKRRSGLLMPEMGYSSVDGFEFGIPFYWNIAPNYDATFTPKYIQRRGAQLKTEFRYLNTIGLGTLAFDWLQNDSQYKKDRRNNPNDNYSDSDHRWLFHWRNSEMINYNWRFNADTTRVSDTRYLTDLDSSYANETDGYLTQHYKVGYTDNDWDISLAYKHFQALSTDRTVADNLYRTEPQLNVNYYNNDIGPFKLTTFGQASYFTSKGKHNPKTWRLHVEPTLDYTVSNSWATLKSEASLMATRYYQDIPNKNYYPDLDKNVNRVIPRFSIDGKVVFERELQNLSGYTQTLEPRVKYTYIAYRKQSNILSYDSSLLQSDYIGLFRDQTYSGLDRIASANKITTGITTRFYDQNKIERFNLSIGQITYFTQSKTGDKNSTLDKNDDTGSITWATDSFWQINDDFIWRGGLQYDTRVDEISLANTIFEYRPTAEKIIQLSYRYANKNYIDAIGVANNTAYKQDISQLGIMATWPLTETVSAVGSYYYDIKLGQTTDGFMGLRYSDCCWGITVMYGKKITEWNQRTGESEYENRVSVNFELRGLGNNNNATAKMLDFGKLPYITAFE